MALQTALGDEQCALCTGAVGTSTAVPFCEGLGAADTIAGSARALVPLSTETVVDRLQAEAQSCYCARTAMVDYTVRHTGCPGMGCGGGTETLRGDYQVTFTLLTVEPVSPPFFACRLAVGETVILMTLPLHAY